LRTIELAAIVAAGTAIVLAPIDPQPLRDLNTPLPKPEPEPAPAFDEALIARVRTGLGLSRWRPNPDHSETETRIVMWSQLELNDLYERVGGTVTSQQVTRTASDGSAWTEEEITVTVDVPGVGTVEATTDWCEDLAKYGARDELPLTRALRALPECPHCAAPADASGCRIPQHDPRCPIRDPHF
jgi:hypothetical protein